MQNYILKFKNKKVIQCGLDIFALSFLFLIFTFSFSFVAQAGVITDAPTLSSVGLKVLSFLLSVFAVIAIIMSVVSGVKYFLAFGDKRDLEAAKKSIRNVVVGIVVALSSMILARFIGSIIGE